MPIFSRLVKSRALRNGAAGSLNGSATVPVSGTASGDNSRGASKTSAEVVGYLNTCFDDWDVNEDVTSNLTSVGVRLNERAKNFPNFGLPLKARGQWEPAQDQLDLMRIGAECSVNVYTASGPNPSVIGLSFTKLNEISASVDGVVKATKFFEVSSSFGQEEKTHVPTLVIAIRGSKTKSLDWLVNFNDEMRNTEGFLGPADGLPVKQSPKVKIDAHAGFLNGARALEPEIMTQLRLCRSNAVRNVLFTGHSAGGAVASLAFSHILSRYRAEYPDFRFSLITFGCPPVTSELITPYLNTLMAAQLSPGVALAIVNEHDPISRADDTYFKTVTDLYNLYGGPATGARSGPPVKPWPFPAQKLHIVGNLIVLKDLSLDDEKRIEAFKVLPEHFGQLIFCDPTQHHKKEYLGNITQLQTRHPGGVTGIDYIASRIE